MYPRQLHGARSMSAIGSHAGEPEKKDGAVVRHPDTRLTDDVSRMPPVLTPAGTSLLQVPDNHAGEPLRQQSNRKRTLSVPRALRKAVSARSLRTSGGVGAPESTDEHRLPDNHAQILRDVLAESRLNKVDVDKAQELYVNYKRNNAQEESDPILWEKAVRQAMWTKNVTPYSFLKKQQREKGSTRFVGSIAAARLLQYYVLRSVHRAKIALTPDHVLHQRMVERNRIARDADHAAALAARQQEGSRAPRRKAPDLSEIDMQFAHRGSTDSQKIAEMSDYIDSLPEDIQLYLDEWFEGINNGASINDAWNTLSNHAKEMLGPHRRYIEQVLND